MIISEKGLSKAMKAAYSTVGYTVANMAGAMAIWTDEWCVKCLRWNLPRKALAMIVEHAGELPEPDSAMYLRKGDDPQWASMDYVAAELAEWWTPAGKQSKAYIVPVVFAGLMMYQTPDKKCYAAEPTYLAILKREIAEALPVQIDADGKAVITQEDQQICIQTIIPAEEYPGKEWMRDAWAALETVRFYE